MRNLKRSRPLPFHIQNPPAAFTLSDLLCGANFLDGAHDEFHVAAFADAGFQRDHGGIRLFAEQPLVEIKHLRLYRFGDFLALVSYSPMIALG